MTISDQITRLNNAKAAIKQSLESKGVEVSDSALLDEYPALIDSIEAGGGEGGGFSFEDYYNVRTYNGFDYSYFFYRSKKPEGLDLSNWDTSNVTNMSCMFQHSNFRVLGSTEVPLDLSSWDTSNVKDMQYMFSDSSFTELDLSNWDTSKVTNMKGMFGGSVTSTSMKIIKGINNFDISKVTNMQDIFAKNWSITSLDVSNWDVGHITASYLINGAFNNCKELVDLYPPQNINADMNFNYSTALSHDSLVRIINNLKTTTSTKTLNLGSTNLAKLTDDEKAIATGKGWTVK